MATTEKLRNRYQIDLEDLQVEFEKVTAQVAVAEKKLNTFDKVREYNTCSSVFFQKPQPTDFPITYICVGHISPRCMQPGP